MVGGAAAALTGLILVAVSLHLRAILGHPLYRDRSFTSLHGLVTILVVAAAALMPQSPEALASRSWRSASTGSRASRGSSGFLRACRRAAARAPGHSGPWGGCCGAPRGERSSAAA